MFLYVISDGTYTKIGVTTDVGSRLSTLQTASPKRLEIVGIVECVNSQSAYYLEKLLHEYLKELRVSGEWFSVSSLQVVKLINLIDTAGKLIVKTFTSETDILQVKRPNQPQQIIRYVSQSYTLAEKWLKANPNHNLPVRAAAKAAGVPVSTMYRVMRKGIQ